MNVAFVEKLPSKFRLDFKIYLFIFWFYKQKIIINLIPVMKSPHRTVIYFNRTELTQLIRDFFELKLECCLGQLVLC